MRHVFGAILLAPALAAAETQNCAKLAKLEGNSCTTLKITADLSACGGSQKQADLVSCEGGTFKAKTKYKGVTYTFEGSGQGWGGSFNWSADQVKVSAKKGEKKDGRTVAQVAPEAAAPEKATPPPAPEAPKVEAKAASAVSAPVVAAPAPAPTPPPTPAPAAVTPAAPAAPEPPIATEFKPVFTPFGDVRHRFETVHQQNPGANKRSHYDQLRLRARAGVKVQASSDVTLEFRMATSTGGPSTNQSYGDGTKGMRNYDFRLDRASAKWSPVPFAYLVVGRSANPLTTVGNNDLLFDADVNFDGTSIGFDQKFGPANLFVRGGYFILEETKDAATGLDVTMNTVQAGANATYGEFKAGVVGSLYHYTNVQRSRRHRWNGWPRQLVRSHQIRQRLQRQLARAGTHLRHQASDHRLLRSRGQQRGVDRQPGVDRGREGRQNESRGRFHVLGRHPSHREGLHAGHPDRW